MAEIDLDALKDSLVRREVSVGREPPTTVPREHLATMTAAADEVEECLRVLDKGGINLVGEILRDEGKFVEWDHYPKGDIYDKETHSQFYYHAHPSDLRAPEHGHFHTFMRAKGLPKSIKPAPMPTSVTRPRGKDAIGHVVGISMDKQGLPIWMFTTNRWVTGESWYAAEDVIKMLDLFDIDHAAPSWPTNRWVGAVIRLFRPQVEWLLRERDEAVQIWQAGHPDDPAYEDHGLEVPSRIQISIDDQVRRVRAAAG